MKAAFLFQVLPYAACVTFGAALLLRALLPGRAMLADASALAEARERLGGGRLWRLSLLLLLIAHLLGVAAPRVILVWNGALPRLYALEACGLLIGACALAGCLRAAWQHFRRERTRTALELADSALLSLLLLALFSGVLLALRFRWASSWAGATVTPYVLSLLHGRPDPALVQALPRLVHLHVCAAFLALAILPCTSVGPFLLAFLARPIAVLNRTTARMFAALAFARRFSPGRWLWPEEDFGGLPAGGYAETAPGEEQQRPPPSDPAGPVYEPDVKG
jgi:nitrate reductase gamma subunit